MGKLDTKDILKWAPALVLLLGVQLILLLNLKFTAWPEMQFWPYLILKGWFPYKDIAVAHNPALLVALSLFYKIFGLGIWQLKVYTWLTIFVTEVLLFWIITKLWDTRVAFYTLAFFIPLQLYYDGNGLWFDLALVPFVLLAYYFQIKNSYFKAGVFWALAFLIKQTAFWFLVPITIYTLQGQSLQGVGVKLKDFTLGALCVFLPAILIVWQLGILPDFLFWAYKFGVWMLPRASGQVSFPNLREAVGVLIPFLLVALLALLIVFRKNKGELQLSTWVLAGAMGAYPRWELFHFQSAVPFLAIAAGIFFSSFKTNSRLTKILSIFYVVLLSAVISRFIIRNWGGQVRFLDMETLKVASYIRENISQGDRIYVLNFWDNIYSLTGTLPATRPWIPHLSWYMELPGVQQELVEGLTKTLPALVVFMPYSEKGLSSYKPKLIDGFISKNYEVFTKINGVDLLKPI